MGLFKKKPGGTFVGNLLRTAASRYTGGILGNGANRIELGQTKTNAQLSSEAGQPMASPVSQAAAMVGGVAMEQPEVKQGMVTAIWSKYKMLVIGLGVALLVFVGFKMFKKKSYRRY